MMHGSGGHLCSNCGDVFVKIICVMKTTWYLDIAYFGTRPLLCRTGKCWEGGWNCLWNSCYRNTEFTSHSTQVEGPSRNHSVTSGWVRSKPQWLQYVRSNHQRKIVSYYGNVQSSQQSLVPSFCPTLVIAPFFVNYCLPSGWGCSSLVKCSTKGCENC